MNTFTKTSLLESALNEIKPQGIHGAVGLIPEGEDPDFKFKEEAQCMMSAGNYRKNEFLAGRECARGALTNLGHTEVPIPQDDLGLPIWPEGVIAVITHSRGYCAALAALQSDYAMLGLDLEMTTRLSSSAIERVVHPGEQDFVQGDQTRATLIFAAKEAFFKAQFPKWHTHANFHDLALNIHEESGEASVQMISDRFPEELRSSAHLLRFKYKFFEDFVLTACWMQAGGK